MIWRIITSTAVLFMWTLAVSAAQSTPDNAPPLLGARITVRAVGELPASDSIDSLLESLPEVIVDRSESGGITLADPSRIGARGSSWTQTTFRVGDVDITDPSGSGQPLLSPGVVEWDRIDVWTGAMPADATAPGVLVTLAPRRPLDTWSGEVIVAGSPSGLNAAPHRTTPVTIARLNTWADATLTAGGRLGARSAGFFAGTAAAASYFHRALPDQFDTRLGSGFGDITVTPSSSDQLRAVVWAQRSSAPPGNGPALREPSVLEARTAVHTQLSWERTPTATTGLRAFAGVTVRKRDVDPEHAPFVVVERLLDGPVPTLLDSGTGTDSAWQAGARFTRAADGRLAHHVFMAGVDFGANAMTMQPAFSGRVGELLNGSPARVWDFSVPGAGSSWSQRVLSAYVSETVNVSPRISANAGTRFQLLRAYRTGTASPAISWNDWEPRAGVRALVTNVWQIGAVAQYGRYLHRLPLGDLAYGDPNAPTAAVYRWNGATPLSVLGPVIQRIGPGTGGDPAFSAIDPQLRRPRMDELVLGFESHPRPTVYGSLLAIARRERSLIGVVDVGVPASSYTTVAVPDPGIDLVGSADDQLLTFYNRSPATFGRDRYLLTNPADDETTFVGVEATAAVTTRRLLMSIGATAGRSEGLAANRGFGPLENDAAVLGDVFIDPNSHGHAQGRLFTERGYTLKTSIGYRLPQDWTASMIGRYQDGQHFARLVVEPLNQGPEAVRAFRNGRTRFTYAMTVDVRLQKRFGFGRRAITAVIDGYNVLNQALEAEEQQVTGAGPRQVSAVQAPRVIHIGARLAF